MNNPEDFEPELGQLLFSNASFEEQVVPEYVQSGIDLIADYISLGNYENDPTRNSGSGEYENNVFAIEPYCWCEGDREGHEDGCPANFETKGDNPILVRWYKHSRRGANINREVSREEWWDVLKACMDSLVNS